MEGDFKAVAPEVDPSHEGSRQVSRAALLAQLTERALTDPAFDRLASAAAEAAAAGVGAEFGLVLQARGSEDLSLVAGYGFTSRRGPDQVSNPLASYALTSAQTVVTADLGCETRFATSELLRHGLVSGICALITVSGCTYGVLGTFSRKWLPFDTDDILFLQTVANIVALAIERDSGNARSPRQSQTRLAAVGAMAAAAAHDFNNTLATINLYAELLSFTSRADRSVGDYLDAIHQQVDHGACLAWRLLEFAHRKPALMRPVEVARFIDEALPFLRRSVSPNVHLIYEGAGVPLWVEADRLALYDVLAHSVSPSAWIAGGDRVTVRVIGPHQEGTTTPGQKNTVDGGRVGIEVARAGGQPLRRCLDGDAGVTRLGAMVREMDGFVDLSPQPDGGSAIWITLPRVDDQHSEGSDTGHEILGGHNEVVLVVEQDPASRRAIVELLRWLNYVPLEAESADAARRELSVHHDAAAVVVGDVEADTLGYDVLAAARTEHRGDRRPVLVAAARPTAVNDIGGGPVVGGAVAASGLASRQPTIVPVEKPFSASQLAHALREVLV